MKEVIVASIVGLVLVAAGCHHKEDPMPGGYEPAAVTDKEVVDAAKFAVDAQQKVMQDEAESKASALSLVRILSAQKQVVAGMNIRLSLLVNVNGTEKEAEAVVWWQAWRKPDPYRLTSWNWKNDGQ